MILSPDASVLVSIVFEEDGWLTLSERLDRGSHERAVSDYAWGEFVAVVGRKVRSHQIRRAVAVRTLARVRAWLADWRWIDIEAADIRHATAFLEDYDLALRLPDAVHLAVAKRIDATLVSTDRQQVAAARTLGVGCVNPLDPA